EIQTHDKKKPLAARILVDTFESDHGPDRSALFERHLPDVACELGAGRKEAQKAPVTRDGTPIDTQAIDEGCAGTRDAGDDLASIDLDRLIGFDDAKRGGR